MAVLMKLSKGLAALAACALLLGGCASGSTQSDMPVGVGAGVNKLKSSPCACIEQPNAAKAVVAG